MPPQKNTTSRRSCGRWLWPVVGLLLVGAALWWIRKADADPSPVRDRTSTGSAGAADGMSPAVATATPSPAVTPAGGGSAAGEPAAVPDPVVVQALRNWLAHLRGLPPGQQADLARQARLQRLVHRASPEQAAAALVAQLATGEDHPTGRSFVVGPEGVMTETPSFRTSLLDLLGQTDPETFARQARELLATTSSPDEYALALRNLAWADPGGQFHGELRSAFQAMLDRPPWQDNPSDGFLEAFDLAVVTGAAGEVARFLPEEDGQTEESPVVRAAFVALDRLMLADPGAVTAWLAAHPAALDGRPAYRASLLSRLDVRVPAQQALLAEYLLRTDHGPEELPYFAAIFPNRNFFTGFRLVTPVWDDSGAIAPRDAATLAVLREWITQPQFAGRRAALETMISRLEKFTEPIGP